MQRTHARTTLAGTALATLALTATSIGVMADSHTTGFDELDRAMAGELAGQVTIQTQWRGAEGENFAAAFQPFIDATGINVVPDIIGTSHETVLRSRVQGNNPPDMAMLAQPAAIQQYGDEGALVDVSTFIDPERLADEHAATIELYQDGDSTWAVPYKVDVKGVVWYARPAFEAAGFEEPQTWDELITIADEIVAMGSAPFCVGMGAGTATGWQATDLVEAAVLRTAGPEAYDAWVTGELPFDSPEVRAALDLAGQIYFTDGYVLGGNTAITALDQTTPMDPMFQGPDGVVGTDDDDTTNPGCWMHIIPFWYGPDFFPDVRAAADPSYQSKFSIGEDGDVAIFPLPPVDPELNPALGAGDGLIVFNDRPEVRAFAQFLSTPAGIEAWVKAGAAVSANTTVPAEWYEGAYESGVASDLLANATAFRFDASDLMPASVGSGTFFTEMVNWIAANGENTEQVLQAIDESWPSS